MWEYNQTNELYHYGILGMRWHHRKRLKEYDKKYEEGTNRILNSSKNMKDVNKKLTTFTKKLDKEYADSIKYKADRDSKKWSTKKKILVGSAITAGIIGGAIGAKKISNYVKSKNREIATIKGWKEYFKNINNGKSFKTSISKYYDITNKANNDNFKVSLKNIIKSR